MDNRRTRKDGRYYQLKGEFVWWPTSVNRGKPWPKEVPVLKARNFKPSWRNPDTRFMWQWVDGFPHDFSKIEKVLNAIRQAAKENSVPSFGGSYRLAHWEEKQTPETLAKVWNRAMEILGYSEPVG